MTQDESFPGRPRGRRARQDDGGPEWQGYDAASSDQREFPDLAPIRPRRARERDARTYGQPEPPASPGRHAGPGGYAGTAAPGYQGGGGQYAGGYPGGDYQGGGYGRPAPGQAPWADQQAPAPQYPEAQYQAPQYQAPERERPPEQRKPEQRKPEEETPSWAEPDSVEEFSERWRRRGREAHREEQQASQRKRRRLLIAGGAVVALAIAATVYLLSGGPGSSTFGFGDDFVDSFLPGELQQVPDPCTTVPASMLSQYLPGKTKEVAPPLNSGRSTECTWTLDSPPTYRVLQVQLQAYSPSGLASGNGSATFAAEDEFESSENGFAHPGANSGQAPATVTDLSGMPGGSDTSAFQATEVTNRGGATMDVANVLVRYRNVIITVVVDGLSQSSGGKTYTTNMSALTSAANAVAKEMASQIAK